jgi:hypothetical protein
VYEAVQKCTHCGAGLSLDDLRQPDCKYCKTVFPHRAQAEQHAQMANQVMGQMMQQQAAIQNQWRGAFGVGPMPGGGGPPGGPPPGVPASPYMPLTAHGNPAGRAVATIAIVVVVLVFLTFVAAGAVFFVVLR